MIIIFGGLMNSSFVLFNNMFYNREEYDTFSDEALIKKMKDGDENAEKCLYKRYTVIVNRISSSFFIIGGANDDLFQEAMIGLIRAVNSYNAEIDCSFRSYAKICIRRQLISAVRMAKAYGIISKCTSICDWYEVENDYITSCGFSAMDNLNPEDVFINKEEKNIYNEIKSKFLSEYERTVLHEYSNGKSYEEISIELHKNIKSIDNALQRIKKKVCINKEKLMY